MFLNLKAPVDFITHISFLFWRIWKHRYDCFLKKLAPNPVQIALSAFQAANEFVELFSLDQSLSMMGEGLFLLAIGLRRH